MRYLGGGGGQYILLFRGRGQAYIDVFVGGGRHISLYGWWGRATDQVSEGGGGQHIYVLRRAIYALGGVGVGNICMYFEGRAWPYIYVSGARAGHIPSYLGAGACHICMGSAGANNIV